jgi:general secretion pathway protein C
VTAMRFTLPPALQQVLDKGERLLPLLLPITKVPSVWWRGLLIALMLLWLSVSLARLVWVLTPYPLHSASPVVAFAAPDASAAAGRSVDLALLADLFGRYDPDAERLRQEQLAAQLAAQQAAAPVELTSLNLKLQGVIASSDPAKSWAIIGEDFAQQLYKIGDEIPGISGVRLKEIAQRWVILDNNGKPEKLWLYGEDGNEVATVAAVPPPPPPVTAAEPTVQAEVSQEQLQGVKSIGDVVRFMVATEGGQMVGYKVRPGRMRELFDQVGLKNDDIVVSVNGIEVNEPQKVREVYQSLQNATEANLEVRRDGSTQFIQIRMSSG